MSNEALPAAIAGGGGVIGRNLVVDNATRRPDQQVDYRLLIEPAVKQRGIEWLVTRMRHVIGNRPLRGEVKKAGNDAIEIEGKKIRVHDGKDIPHDIYREEGIDLVMEATGGRTSAEKAREHGKRVIITANASGEAKNVVVGVNHQILDPEDREVGNGSCTTKSVSIVGKTLEENFGVAAFSLVTTHAHTGGERAEITEDFETGTLPRLDGTEDEDSDEEPLLPDTYEFSADETGAGKGAGLVVPELRGKVIKAVAFRGPVLNGSFTTVTFILNQETSKDEIVRLLKEVSERNPSALQLVNLKEGGSNPFKTTADVRNTKADAVVLVDQIGGFGKYWTFVIGYNNEEAPARAANDLVLHSENRFNPAAVTTQELMEFAA